MTAIWLTLKGKSLEADRLIAAGARSISTPPGRDASPSQVIPPQFVRFPLLDGERLYVLA